MSISCNPINVQYRYQFVQDARMGGSLRVFREAADPSVILFKGKYYLFSSMSLSVWVSEDLANWTCHRLPDTLPLYDYAPDVRVGGDWVYFCASRRDGVCDRWRTQDILGDQWERLPGTFAYWDPNQFFDDDGRIYFYWGCSNNTPLMGVELDPDTMNPMGEPVPLIVGNPAEIGYERTGEDHCQRPATEEEITESVRAFLKASGGSEEQVPPDIMAMLRSMFSRYPYIEGAWMNKHEGRYYLQYAAPGTEYNVYADGVYVSDRPLGPFTLADNTPYSYKPGGFMPGAGHGTTWEDSRGSLWHASTMRISTQHPFERRIGLWPAGFDREGSLFCNQRYGDWPFDVDVCRRDPWSNPPWMLLSVGRAAAASSFEEGHEAANALEEDVRTWWRPAQDDAAPWLCMDLGKAMNIHALQINFADDGLRVPCPGEIVHGEYERFIDPADHATRWLLEGSIDGADWFVIEDKTGADTDLSHDLIVREDGFAARWVRLSRISVPYGQTPCVSGLRVFGLGEGALPGTPVFSAARTGELDAEIDITGQPDATGYCILFGSAPDKLYHSKLVFRSGRHSIGAFVKGRKTFFSVEALNENGITRGTTVSL